MGNDLNKMHLLNFSTTTDDLPTKFTYPFNYIPHPLCIKAAERVQDYLNYRTQWKEELSKGKMFGVLIVEKEKKLYFLAAFSGNLDHKNNHKYFVPPVYDLLKKEGFFLKEEKIISNINKKITLLENSTYYKGLLNNISILKIKEQEEIAKVKNIAKEAKKKREKLRKTNLSKKQKENLIKESQFQKAEIKRIKNKWKNILDEKISKLNSEKEKINTLKEKRKSLSTKLQTKLFSKFSFYNYNKEQKDLLDIFKETTQKIPPSGAGECAAPKLLQYAFLNNLKPLAMAEFWWGESPKSIIRHHKQFYPSCNGKCRPILKHMLKGLEVDLDPLSKDKFKNEKLEIVYQDDYLAVVNKPAGMLSIPGKNRTTSILDKVKEYFPKATGPMIVHRLDMSTSGLMLIAKNKEIHKALQQEFLEHKINKKYVALLNGKIKSKIASGTIEIPISSDYNNSPMQKIDLENGKKSITKFEILSIINGFSTLGGYTRVNLYPLTGRTHQLRIHCAHSLGFGIPIMGDSLYGKSYDITNLKSKKYRLFLHAQTLSFIHPITKKNLKITRKADF